MQMNSEKLYELLNDMSLPEKIGQLLQVSGIFFENEGVLTGPENSSGFKEAEIKSAGSILGSIGAEKLKKIQKEYMEQHPHHIPLLFMCDIINGYRTIFPIPLAQGCSFDPSLAYRAAEIAAKEAAVCGLHLTFSPMADLVEDPRWGRVMESTGEDPWLNGQFAKAMVEGYQGKTDKEGKTDLSSKGKIAACVKHFAGYGAPVGGRDYNSVELSERTFRDFYLPSYKAAVDAGAAMVMTSFNTLNRIPSSGNKNLLQDILRDEMRFDGVVISDWAAIEEMINHGTAENEKEAAWAAIKSGVDIDMCTTCYIRHLKELIEEKRINIRTIDDAVMRVLRLKNKLGLFENPYKDANESDEKKFVLCKEHRRQARAAAADTFVLLKNEEILPLKKESKIAYIGPQVENREIFGMWSLFGREEDTISIADALRGQDANAVCVKGSAIFNTCTGLEYWADKPDWKKDGEDAESLLREAEEAAKNADIAVLVLGEHRLMTGEGASRADISVPECQMELFRRVQAVNSNTIVVLFTGRPLDIREISKKARAVLVVWQPGTEGGNAILDVLYGRVNPSAKLTISFPYCVGQIPVFYNGMRTGRPYVDEKDRFLSRYLDIPNKPLYPFGYGLSYTEFSISKIELDKSSMKENESIQACVTVKNEGRRKGKEVVQLYIKDHFAKVARPIRELKAVQKIELNPGEEKKVTFTITEEMLEYIGIDMKYTADKGKFSVYIGDSSETQNEATFELEKS